MSEAASAGSRPGDDASQKRALFYVFDGGTGIGHLRRLACIARQLQGRFACLIVTGHREAAHWFVPQACEYVHLPSWDSLIAEKARYWGREPFADLDRRGAIRLRREILHGIVSSSTICRWALRRSSRPSSGERHAGNIWSLAA